MNINIEDKFNFNKAKKSRSKYLVIELICISIMLAASSFMIFLIIEEKSVQSIFNTATKAIYLPRNSIENYLEKEFSNIQIIKNSDKITYRFKSTHEHNFDFELTVAENEKIFKLMNFPLDKAENRVNFIKEKINNIQEIKYMYNEESVDVTIIEKF